MADLDYLINFNSNTTGIDQSRFAISKLSAAMAALGIGFGANELANIADEYSNIASRINIAVGETGNFQSAMDGVRDVALATNSNLTATTLLFTKINDAGKQLGLTQQQSLELTETINKAMQLGGGSAESNEAAIVQLTQSLQSGVLRGDEFNSIMEQAPGISKALADSLGVTTGELRGMAEEGKLSAQTVITALQDQSASIAADYDKMAVTIDKALQNIRTRWLVLLGEFNQNSGASSKVVEWLGALEDSMGMLDTVLADIGEGVQWVGDKIDGIDTGTIVAMKQAFESAYDTLKTLASTVAEGFEDLAGNLNLTLGMLFDFDSGLTNAESNTAGFTKAIQALSVALGFISDGFAGISIASKLISGAFYDLSAAWQQVIANLTTGSWKDEAIANMEAMEARAQEMYDSAGEAALEFRSKGIAALGELRKTEEEINAETLVDLKDTFRDKEQAYQDYILNEQNYTAQRIELEKQVSEARKNGDSERIADLLNRLDEVTTKEQESAEKRIGLEQDKLAAAQKFAQQAVDANGGVLDSETKLELATQNYTASVDEAGKASVEAFGVTQGAANEAKQSMKDIALNAAKGLGVDVPNALNQVSVGFQRNAENAQRVADGFGELKSEGVNAGNLLSASLEKLLEGAKSQAEIDTVRRLYVQFGQEGKLSTRQVETSVDAVNEKLSKSPEALDETARAFKELGIISQAEADKQAKAAIANYEIVKQSGQASAEQLGEALDGVYSKIQASGNATLENWYNTQKAALGLGAALNEVEDSASRANEALRNNADERDRQATATDTAASATANATQNESVSLAVMQQATNAIRDKILALSQMGATTAQTDAAWSQLMSTLDGKRWLGLQDFAAEMKRVDEGVNKQIDNFTRAKNRADEMTQALGGSAATSRDLADAQHALRQATDASVEGIIRMDEQTLSRLQNAIDSARSRMQGLADDAKDTADSLEASLAKLQGNEDKARDIEQTRKLTELEEKLNDAKARGNAEEVKQLERALTLQKQINTEEDKKAAAESVKQNTTAASNSPAPVPRSTSNVEPVSSNAPASRTVTVIFELGGSMPEIQDSMLLAMLKRLAESKAISGY